MKFSNWIFPDSDTMLADYNEYKAKEDSKWKYRAKSMGFRFPIFESFNDFKKSLKNAQVIIVTEDMDCDIENRSHCGSVGALKSLVNSYKYPRDVNRIIDGFKHNDTIPYPIILKGKNGMWIMAGNTRMDSAFIKNIEPSVLLVDVSI